MLNIEISATCDNEKKTLVIQSGTTNKEYWEDIWRHRELLFFLAWRDILVRYKQTVIGVSWVVIRPLVTMLILTAVFGRIANLSSGETPYSILVFAGLLPWFFFTNAVSDSSNSLITNSNLLSKVYFPRLIVPISSILVSFVDFAISIIVLLLLMIWYGIMPTWQILLIPLLGGLIGLLALGFGLWFSALNVRYRDFRHLVPFMLQLGVYASPIGYSSSVIPEKWLYLYYLNPVAGLVDCFRWSIIGVEPSYYGLAISLLEIVFLLVTGVIYFRKEETRFADDI